jgi:hypothetical protein
MIRRSLAILAIMTILGASIGLIAGSYFNSDKRIEWEYVGNAPEKLVGFMYTYQGFLVEGSSGRLYANCGVDCWSSDDIESYLQYEVEDLNCIERDPPDLPGLELEASFCEPWGPGMIYRSFGVSNGGVVYAWETRVGEWDFLAALILPIAVTLGFILIGLLIVLVGGFNAFLENLRQKALDR